MGIANTMVAFAMGIANTMVVNAMGIAIPGWSILFAIEIATPWWY